MGIAASRAQPADLPPVRMEEPTALAGPLPAEIQSYVTFTGGVGTSSQAPEAARDSLRLLTGLGDVVDRWVSVFHALEKVSTRRRRDVVQLRAANGPRVDELFVVRAAQDRPARSRAKAVAERHRDGMRQAHQLQCRCQVTNG